MMGRTRVTIIKSIRMRVFKQQKIDVANGTAQHCCCCLNIKLPLKLVVSDLSYPKKDKLAML